MFKIGQLYDKLQRKTNSTSFIPQIDGLRFLAILPVVIAHLNIFVVAKSHFVFTENSFNYWLSYIINESAIKGVMIFFVISGFILVLPFAKQFLQGGKIVSLKSYFFRRLTRLEPPYILNNIAYAVLLVLFARHEYAALFPKGTILPHLGASLFYLHNILYPSHAAINYVTWSLEVEIQFYLLVPLLVLILKLPKFFRRVTLTSLIFLFPFLQHYYTPHFLSIYSFIQYFLIGFLLADLYLSGFKIKMNEMIDFLVGLLALIGVLGLSYQKNVFAEYGFIILILTFFIITLTGEFWRKVLSVRTLTTIGGMCYSIYLWHTAVISGIGNHITSVGVSGNYLLTLLLQMAIVLPILLVITTIFYLLIEQPCMDKNWPIKFWNFVNKNLKLVN